MESVSRLHQSLCKGCLFVLMPPVYLATFGANGIDPVNHWEYRHQKLSVGTTGIKGCRQCTFVCRRVPLVNGEMSVSRDAIWGILAERRGELWCGSCRGSVCSDRVLENEPRQCRSQLMWEVCLYVAVIR